MSTMGRSQSSGETCLNSAATSAEPTSRPTLSSTDARNVLDGRQRDPSAPNAGAHGVGGWYGRPCSSCAVAALDASRRYNWVWQ
jgi:hypothetical protein